MSEPIPDKSPLIIAISTLLIVLPTTAISLRFISRHLSKAGLWWDDWVILLALPFSLALNTELLYGVHHGFGKHAVNGPSNATTIFFQLLFGGELLYNSCVTLCKLSLLLFYYRIFGPVKPFRIALGAVAILVICWFLSMSFAAIFACSPVQRAWNPSLPGHCTNLEEYFIGQAVPNVVTDFVLLLLPVPLLLGLHVARPEKVALIGVFVLGYFVPVVSVLRLVATVQLGAKAHEDVTWNVVTLYLWSSTEPAIAIVSTCIPSISYLFKRMIKSSLPSPDSENHRHGIFNDSGYTTPGKQRHKSSGLNDFIRLKDAPPPIASASLESSGQNYSVAIDAQDTTSIPTDTSTSEEECSRPSLQIHVRKDLDLSYEQAGYMIQEDENNGIHNH